MLSKLFILISFAVSSHAFRIPSNFARHSLVSTKTQLCMADEITDLRNIAIIAHVGMYYYYPYHQI
jgi:hypothetical protein